MKNVILNILFFLLSIVLFSQENTQKIIFNTKGEIFTPLKNEYKKNDLNKTSTLRADVEIKEGKFSILLIDFNKNGSFNDYRGCCRQNGGSDGIIITDYQENKVAILYNQRRFITKNYPIAFNGKTFKINNLHKNKKGFYEANLVKRIVNLDDIFKTRNKVIIDSLPSMVLNNYYNNKEVNILSKLQKDKNLLVKVMSHSDFSISLQFGDSFISGNNSSDIDKTIKKYYPNTIIETIVVINRQYNYIINEFNPNKKEFLTIDAKEKEKITQLGYNMQQLSIMLFNEKGKIIFTDYNNFVKLKDLEKKKKLKLKFIKKQ